MEEYGKTGAFVATTFIVKSGRQLLVMYSHPHSHPYPVLHSYIHFDRETTCQAGTMMWTLSATWA